MSRLAVRGRSPKRSADRKILVFGEDENDRQSLKTLIEALCPGAVGKVETRRQPLVLIKGRPQAEARSQAEKIAAVIRATAVRNEVAASFLHEDCDDLEPKHEAICTRIEREMRAAECPGEVHAVVPAWEIEAWWLLWPEVFPDVNRNWALPKKYETCGTGSITNAKEHLKQELRKGNAGKHDYRESDSLAIARRVKTRGLANAPTKGRNRSYDRFRESVKRVCENL